MDEEGRTSKDEEDEEEEDEGGERPRNIPFDFAALIAQAESALEEEEEEDVGPIEHALRMLREGKQVYRMKTVRDMTTLIHSHTHDTVHTLLPQLQTTLESEKNNLDLHCEAAVLYKDLITNTQLIQTLPTLPETLLEYIIDNAHKQNENLSAAAWLETVTEVAHHLPVSAVRATLLPVLLSQCHPTQKVQRRLIATKLLEKLSSILTPADIRRDFERPITLLCCDENKNVRSSMADRLKSVAMALGKASDISRLVLPFILSLCEADEMEVREKALPTLVSILPTLTKEHKKLSVTNFFRKTIDKGMDEKGELIVLMARYFGEFLYSLFEVFDVLDQTWALNTYTKMCHLFNGDSASSSRATCIKRHCAYNLPCMMKLYPKACGRLHTLMHDLCTDHDDEVRLCIASSFHQLLLLSTDRKGMVTAFMELVRGGSIEVVAKMSERLSAVLPLLYETLHDAKASDPLSCRSIDRLILGCNQLLQGSSSWRSHESLLLSLSSLHSLVSLSTITDTFVPLLQREILQSRAVPCREAACRSLLILMRHLPQEKDRLGVVKFFTNDVAKHCNCYRRILYLNVVLQVLELFSRRVFHQLFLSTALEMASDPISNIRLKLCRILSVVKKSFILPEDEELLQRSEAAVREVLERERGEHCKKLLAEVAKDLSRAVCGKRTDEENARKEREEDELWGEGRAEQTKERENHTAENSPEDRLAPTPSSMSRSMVEGRCTWRLERRAVAVVRPQPVVLVRSQSPAPVERKSRLPLSTTPTPSGVKRTGTTVTSSPSPSTSSPSYGKDRMRAQSETRTTSTTSSSTSARPSTISSSSNYALSKSASSSHVRRPTFALSKVSSSSNIERRPPSMSMRIKNINVL